MSMPSGRKSLGRVRDIARRQRRQARQPGRPRAPDAGPSPRSRLAASLSVQGLIETLIVEGAARGCELLAVSARMRRHAVCFCSLAITPELDDREMVLAVGLHHGLKTQIAVVLTAILGELFGERRAVLPLRRNDIDMGHGRDGRLAGLGRKRGNRQGKMGALIKGSILDGFDLVAKLRGRLRLAMSVGTHLILPCLEQHELVW